MPAVAQISIYRPGRDDKELVKLVVEEDKKYGATLRSLARSAFSYVFMCDCDLLTVLFSYEIVISDRGTKGEAEEKDPFKVEEGQHETKPCYRCKVLADSGVTELAVLPFHMRLSSIAFIRGHVCFLALYSSHLALISRLMSFPLTVSAWLARFCIASASSATCLSAPFS
jgi:hypothetical protein